MSAQVMRVHHLSRLRHSHQPSLSKCTVRPTGLIGRADRIKLCGQCSCGVLYNSTTVLCGLEPGL